jgi:hypothetical protein
MGMPVMLYRWYFGAYGVRGFERSMLSFAGIKPIREEPWAHLWGRQETCALHRGHAQAWQAGRLTGV